MEHKRIARIVRRRPLRLLILSLFISLLVSTAHAETTLDLTPKVMVDIAYCESGMRQFDDKGHLLRNPESPSHVGIYQISEYYFKKEAADMGYDIETPEGNTAFALYLYQTQGTRPWNASKVCWGPKEELAFSG